MGLKQLLIFYERKSFGLPAFIEDNTETSWMVFQSWTNVIWQRLIEKWLESFERKMKSVNFYNISLVLLLYIGQSLHKRNPGNHSLCSTDDKYNIVSKVRENSFFSQFAIIPSIPQQLSNKYDWIQHLYLTVVLKKVTHLKFSGGLNFEWKKQPLCIMYFHENTWHMVKENITLTFMRRE